MSTTWACHPPVVYALVTFFTVLMSGVIVYLIFAFILPPDDTGLV